MAINNAKRILVIRLSAMGDVAMAVPVLTALRKTNPHVEITVLTRAFFAPIFENIPNVSVYAADVKGLHKGIGGLWKLYRSLHKLKFDAVVDIHNVLRSTILKQFFKLSKVPFVQVNKGRQEKKELTALRSKQIKPLQTTCERYAEVFRAIGLSLDLSDAKPLNKGEVPIKFAPLPTKIAIGIAPFAAFDAKKYPQAQMEAVLSILNTNKNYTVYLFGGPADNGQLTQWEATYSQCINVSCELTFKEELDLISNLNVMLSMDSGNGHLAAMYGVSVLTLWGNTHPYAGFSPFNFGKNKALLPSLTDFPFLPTSVYGNKVPDGYEKVMETITPANVVATLEGMLPE